MTFVTWAVFTTLTFERGPSLESFDVIDWVRERNCFSLFGRVIFRASILNRSLRNGVG